MSLYLSYCWVYMFSRDMSIFLVYSLYKQKDATIWKIHTNYNDTTITFVADPQEKECDIKVKLAEIIRKE